MIKPLKYMALFTLVIPGCAGSEQNPAGVTHITGVLCGAPFELHDGKERGEIVLEVTCPDGSTATLTSAESLAFDAQAAAQADQARTLELINRLVFGAAGAVVRGQPPRMPPPLIPLPEEPSR